jgi:hypothetical protein
MVYISEKYKIIFFNTANTKSEEVVKFLKNNISDEHSCELCNGICVNDPEFFLSCFEVKDKIGIDKWDEYVKFAIVRNTYERIVQSYIDNDGKLLYFSFDKYLTEDQYIVDNWDLYTINDEIQLDVIINYENLETELNEFFRSIGLKKTITISKTKKINVNSYLNINNIKLINNIYEKDITYFDFNSILS